MVIKVHSNADLTCTVCKSIFVTNFPDNTTSADIWKTCQTYGVVVDVYIPNRRSNVGKRFAFVRFIKSQPPPPTRPGKIAPLFVSAVKGILPTPVLSPPAMVLDDSCMVTTDLRNYVMGEVKLFSSVKYLHVILSAEGFSIQKPNNIFLKKLRFTPDKPDTDVGEPVAQKDQFQPDVKSVGSSSHTVESANNENKDVNAAATNLSIPFPPDFTPDKPDTDVGQTMGFSMEGSIKDIERIIDLKGADDVETKAENVSGIEINSLWDNTNFDAIVSQSLGNSRGLLCVWDPNSFQKDNHIISDNFIALFSKWRANQTRMLIVFVYAPQAVDLKRTLCSYLSSFINRWNGECIVMGDFNEVRRKEERWGSTFNVYGARDFNQFMCLDRHLSDHRPILLREFNTDYGATPFCLFHSWFDFQGFDDMITQTWNSISLNDSNAMVRFKKKLQALKKVIRLWIRNYKRKQMNRTTKIKSKLKDIDKLLNQIGAHNDLLSARSEVLKQYHDIQSVVTHESIQKAKIKWAIEGDENSKFFHGMINRKRANLAVKGVMIKGEWVDDPSIVKDEFRDYFASRFYDSGIRHGVINFNFPNRLNIDQPISLIGSIYKVVTKILANRLSTVIADITLNVKTAFLPNRQTLDGPFIINELLARCHQKNIVLWFLRSTLLKRMILSGIFIGIKIDSLTTLSHLFYADDAVFIGEWSRGNLTGIMHTLRCFSLLSGLSINLKKSQLLGVGIPDSQVLEAATLIGCSVLNTLFKYLGIMVGENMSSIRAWDETVNKLKLRLSSWKLKTLSIGGRLTLLKLVLGSTPIYNMSLFKVPKAVLKSMESIRLNFFNGIRDGKKKIAWVSWSKVLTSKSNGGLGISCFYALNRGLLFKWIWWFLSRDQSLWSQVIHALHGSNTSTLSSSYSSLWSSITKECNTLKSQGDSCLRLSYPRLFAPENNKVCTVATKMSAPFVSSLRRDIPIKVNVLAWKIFMDRLPTRVNLHWRSV
nr:RNA-directed DNA polymerase, eukaryota, reverse transcriptase zinc-binding domain protein [Tanacetum cinerariifolium]